LLIEPYTEAHILQIHAFNERLRKGGSSFQFSTNPSAGNAFVGSLNEIRSEHYVVLDNSRIVRGAYTIVFQRFLIAGVPEKVGFLQIPISEGSVNSAFGIVGLLLLKDALRRSPLLFGLGMGGIDRPLPKLFRALGAWLCEVPFLFRVVRARSFLRNATVFRSTPLLRLASKVASTTGLGTLGLGLIHSVRSSRSVPAHDLSVECTVNFQESADQVWLGSGPNYSCIAFRDCGTLNQLYPERDPRYHRLTIHQQKKMAGWALVTDSQMRNHNHFGDMRVGAIVNCLAQDNGEDAVIAGATRFLRQRGVDLIVSNQLHPGWVNALRRAGYLSFRSNFVLALAPALSAKIKTIDPTLQRVHMNRGDGDGAYNL